ncbi:hypothetical protein Hanom_Chr05g00390141 [Helianthus anomalus]
MRLEECFHISIVIVVSHRLALFRYELASLRLSFLPQFNRPQFNRVLRFFHDGVLFELCRQLGRASIGRCRLILVSTLCSLWRGVFVHIGYGRVHVNRLSFLCRTLPFLTQQWDLGHLSCTLTT